MARQSDLFSAVNNADSYLENDRSSYFQFVAANFCLAMMNERDAVRGGTEWINDLIVNDLADGAVPVAIAEDGSNNVKGAVVNTPIAAPFQTLSESAPITVSRMNPGSTPGDIGGRAAQRDALITKHLQTIDRTLTSNQASSKATADNAGSRTSGLMNYGRGADAIALGSGGTAYSNAGYDAASKVTASVNDLKTDAAGVRGAFSLDDAYHGAVVLNNATSGANLAQDTMGQRSTITGGDFICVVPQLQYRNIAIPTSGVASQVRNTGGDIVYKKRGGAVEGLAYPMSVSYVETTFGNVYLIPGQKQFAVNGAHNGALPFIFDPTATEVVFSMRPTTKDVYESNPNGEVLVFCRFAIAGLTRHHVRLYSHPLVA